MVLLITRYKKIANEKFKGKILETIDNYDMTDIILDKNPEKSLFTWHNSKHKSRIDYVLISEKLGNIIKYAKTIKAIQSDHNIVSIDILFIKVSCYYDIVYSKISHLTV